MRKKKINKIYLKYLELLELITQSIMIFHYKLSLRTGPCCAWNVCQRRNWMSSLPYMPRWQRRSSRCFFLVYKWNHIQSKGIHL
uniref:Uncharacterized protein n=1 Tax=Megaselia scalaris TaxID=36166 RepID=T1GRI3_MEGSC